MKWFAFLLFAFAFAPAFAADVNKAPWMEGERLSYSLSWGFFSAGSADMNAIPKENRKIEFESVARNNGAFKTIYPVADTIHTLADSKTLLPDYFRKILNEGSYFNSSLIRFDRHGQKAILSDSVFFDSRRKNVKSHVDTTIAIKGYEHCIVSAFYLVRSMDFSAKKDSYFAAVSGKKRYTLKVIVHGKETVETGLGSFRCIKVEPVLGGDGIFKTSGRLFIWITDDSRRLPVLMKTEITIGSIRAELTRFKQGASE
ncbi:MAG: DUF3108 domain-containing protein [Fibrobacteraceae bacterium]|nr:DUF3108 domain-containing protein [Fibrobacteraceae bacterium]